MIPLMIRAALFATLLVGNVRCASSTVAARPSQPLKSEQPFWRGDAGVLGECPAEQVPIPESAQDCGADVIRPYLVNLHEAAGRLWNPWRFVRSDDNVRRLIRLDVKVHESGAIMGRKLQGSSGWEALDTSAFRDFEIGAKLPAPPRCALSPGFFQFSLGLCYDPIRLRKVWKAKLSAAQPGVAAVDRLPRSARSPARR
jgi:hypothetical protein